MSEASDRMNAAATRLEAMVDAIEVGDWDPLVDVWDHVGRAESDLIDAMTPSVAAHLAKLLRHEAFMQGLMEKTLPACAWPNGYLLAICGDIEAAISPSPSPTGGTTNE